MQSSFIDNSFLFDAKEKAKKFISYFSKQCEPLVNDSNLPNLTYLTDQRLTSIAFSDNDILSLIRGLNKNKSCGPDNISAHMLLICDTAVITPLRFIFSNILSTGTYPVACKQANLTPIHKKGSKQLVTNYRPISLLPICSKILE